MKELEDHSWFPNVLRNYQTEFIGFVVSRFNLYGDFIKHLKTLTYLQQTMYDLCSGSGEPAISIFRKSKVFSHLVLSDKYPNGLPFQDDKIVYQKESADALEMDYKPGMAYTMFNAFHHFNDEEKLNIIKRIQDSGSSAFFVEILEPGIVCLFKVILATTVGTILFTAFVKPFSIKRLFFTYIIPVNIFTITMDGIISVFKSGSVNHYKKLFTAYEDVKILRLTKGFAPLVIIQIEPGK